MEVVKLIHVTCAILTGLSFSLRGIWMIMESPLFKAKLTRVFPHVIDTCLLVSAVILAFYYQLNPLLHSWLLAKIVLLLLYIFSGMAAFRFAKEKSSQIAFWLLSLLLLAGIYYAALSKQVPLFFL